MTTKRLFRVKYEYRLYRPGTINHGLHRTAKLFVEASTMEIAVRAATRAATRCCLTLGDERFVKLIGLKDKGAVANG